MNKVLILGIGGQDGSYLAELLVEKGVEVHGTTRRSSVENEVRLRNVSQYVLHVADLADHGSVDRVLRETRPQAVYNLADQDLVGASYSTPSYSVDVTAGAVARLLESVKAVDKTIRVFQPCSATVFGGGHTHPCDEDTPFSPESPYACAKAHAYYLARMYRARYGMFVSTAFLYGHNSDRQKCEYLLHRIAREAVEKSRVNDEQFAVTNPSYRVDIGYAKEFVQGMYDLMQCDHPNDVVMSTGRTFSVYELYVQAAYEAGIDMPVFDRVVTDEAFNKSVMTGYSSRAKELFRWNPQTHALDVIDMLVEHYRKVLK